MTELLTLSDKLDELNGSELKAIVAIFIAGKYLTTTELGRMTGMARKTCIKAMRSGHVKEAIEIVEGSKDVNKQQIIHQMRKQLNNLERDAQ